MFRVGAGSRCASITMSNRADLDSVYQTGINCVVVEFYATVGVVTAASSLFVDQVYL